MKIKPIFEGLLTEKLTNIDDDVNLLYGKYFESDVNKIKQTGMILSSMFITSVSNTSVLKTENCVNSNAKNNCVININYGSNYYQPSKNKISLSVSDNALAFVLNDYKGDLKRASHDVGDIILREFSEERIKGSIHHELVHWIDDTQNNRHINKILKNPAESSQRMHNGVPINASKMEIQAQIHNIKQLHNKYSNIWDTLTFHDMLKFSPPLSSVFKGLKDDFKSNWIRDIKTRMHREGLLGKKMYN